MPKELGGILLSLDKDIDLIEESDLEDLKAHGVIENKTLEYKMQLPGNSDPDKKEFLADISSFANASGGHIIYGIAEGDNGAPESIPGLDIESPDKEIQRLDNIIRDSIEPRIPGLLIKEIPLSNSKYSLIVKIPRSWISPHRVTYKGHDKFYGRSSNGKYPLDVAELRTAFTLSDTIAERIRRFREDRISSIYANDLPVPFIEGAKTVLHIIPINSFKPGQQYNINCLDQSRLRPMNCSGWNYRYNFDGIIDYSGKDKSRSYVQLYRNGIIEAVDGGMLSYSHNLIPSAAFENEIINSLSRYITILKTLNVEPVYIIFVTLLGVNGYELGLTDRFWADSNPIDRDIILIPEVIVENFNIKADIILRPIFDSIWNACGYPKDLYYDEAGNWNTK